MKKKRLKDSPNAEKLKGGPYSFAGYYGTLKKEQLFYFSSLYQMVPFDTLKFRRSLKNYFGQFISLD